MPTPLDKLIRIITDINKAIDLGDKVKTKKLLKENEAALSDINNVETSEDLQAQIDTLNEKIESDPMFYAKDKFVEELTGDLQDAFKLFTNIRERAAVKEQLTEADRRLEQLGQPPAQPAAPPISTSVKEQTETARRELNQPSPVFEAARQQNNQLLQEAINQAKTAGAGNAATTGAVAQSAVNQARRSNNMLSGREAQDRQVKVGNLNNALRLEEAAKLSRFGTQANLYNTASANYNELAQAVGLMGTKARDNEVQNRRNFAETIPGLGKFSGDLMLGAKNAWDTGLGGIFGNGVNTMENVDIDQEGAAQIMNDYGQHVNQGLEQSYGRNAEITRLLNSIQQLKI